MSRGATGPPDAVRTSLNQWRASRMHATDHGTSEATPKTRPTMPAVEGTSMRMPDASSQAIVARPYTPVRTIAATQMSSTIAPSS